MPQFDIAWFPSQIFWLVISFIILYVGIARFLLPPVVQVISERKQKIQSILREADETNSAADRLRQEHEKYINKAEEQSARIMQKAHEDIVVDHMQQEQHFLKVLKKSSLNAETDILKRHQAVYAHIKEITVQFLNIVFDTLYKIQPKRSSVSRAVKEHLEEFPK